MTHREFDDNFLIFLQKAHVPNPEDLLSWCKNTLPEIIRQEDSSYNDLYEHTDHHYFDALRSRSAQSDTLKAADDRTGGKFSRALKMLSGFLQSRYFPQPEVPLECSGHQTVKTLLRDDYSEGAKRHVEQERRFRNRAARQACIDHWGYQCQCCGMDFAEAYGKDLGEGYIQVHHLRPISSYEEAHSVDPIRDLVPLCANCHVMIHHGKDGVLTLKALRGAYHGPKFEIKKLMPDE
jgi:hypothetical protein